MTSPSESVEIVEVTWKIPNFGEFSPTSPSSNVADFHKVVFIGGRLPPGYPQSKSPPVKVEVSVCKIEVRKYLFPTTRPSLYNLSYHWRFTFAVVSVKSELPPPCVLRGRFLQFKTFDGEYEHTFAKGMKIDGYKESMDLSKPHHYITLFDTGDAEKYVDKSDGSLNIYFKMEVTCSGPKPSEGMEFTELFSGIESLLKNPEHSDVEIKVTLGEGRTFLGHKIILAGRSEVFRAMFASDMKESKSNVVEVDDILPKTMEHFLSFLYCGRFQDSSWIRSLPQLAYAANKYCVKSLQNICDLHLGLNVTPENALTLWLLARRYGLMKAAEDIWAFRLQFSIRHLLAVTIDTDSDTSNSDGNFVVRYSVPAPE